MDYPWARNGDVARKQKMSRKEKEKKEENRNRKKGEEAREGEEREDRVRRRGGRRRKLRGEWGRNEFIFSSTQGHLLGVHLVSHITWSIKMENNRLVSTEIFLCCIVLGKTGWNEWHHLVSWVCYAVIRGRVVMWGHVAETAESVRQVLPCPGTERCWDLCKQTLHIESHTDHISCKQKLLKRNKQATTDPFNLVL